MHTDLLPIILGFRRVVREGREAIESTTRGNTTVTSTTTYGYLTDEQFQYASEHVARILSDHSVDKQKAMRLAREVHKKVGWVVESLAAFRKYFTNLDSHSPVKMRSQDAARLVQLHSEDATREWNRRITAIRKATVVAETFVQSQAHYTPSAVEQLKVHIGDLSVAVAELTLLRNAIDRDVTIMGRYNGDRGWLARLFRR